MISTNNEKIDSNNADGDITTIWVAPNFDNVPDDLKLQRWAVWKAEPRPDKPGKFNKAPRSPRTGHKIGANQPELFGTYDEAKDAYESGRYTGIGVLLTGNGIVGFDIDDYVTTFSDKPEVQVWVEQAISDKTNPAYAELSPSGKGLRLFIRGMLPDKGRKQGNLEVYDNERFLTLTGVRYEA
jgi:putative DNA primase/helicase